MTNYTKTTDFAAKDALPSGNSAKIVKGSEIDTEFNNIATASATKANANSAALTGTTTFETISDGTIAITAFVDEDNMASDSATLLPTQQSVKAYVDSQVTAQDLDVTDGSTSIDIDLDSESLGILGGTGIDSTASGTGVTLAIDATVATLTGSQTLSNKTLSAPVVSGNLTTDGLLDGRDVAADGTKLDGIEASADVTDTANVTAAGALMDSELTSEASVKALNQGVATTDSPTFAGLTTTADVSFGDNDKAIFGAGSDLQIYHDGSHSYISEQGTGNLRILAGDLRIRNSADAEAMISATENAAVTLFYDGASKLATTSTGIDVTGTVTADGLTVDGDGSFTGAFEISNLSPKIFLSETDTTDVNTRIRNAGGKLQIQTVDNSDANPVTRFQIDHSTGDVSLYEDTGTTPKLFWDSSAESLGIGTSLPSKELHVMGASHPEIRLQNTSNNYALDLKVNGTVGEIKTSDDMAFLPGGSEAMRIDSSGNVGIGHTSSFGKLTINSNGAPASSGNMSTGLTVSNGTAGTAINIGTNDSGAYNYIQSAYVNSASTARNLAFFSGASESMRIDSSGNLLVGTTSGSDKINVYQAAGGTICTLESAGTAGAYALQFKNPNGTVGNVTISGTTTTYNTSSDQRLKENIVDAPSASDDIDAIQVRSFDWKADGSHQKYGMVAQELQSVAPEAVSGDADSDEMMGVDYSKLVPMLVKEIQSLRNRVAQLENN